MKGGAFQVSREIFDNPIWNDVAKFRIFFYIFGNAVFSEDGTNVAGIHLKQGQFLRSYRKLSDDLQYVENRQIKEYSISHIKKKVDQLVKENRLKTEDTELGTLFTVVNYALYQGLDNYKISNRERSENSMRTARERSENNNKNVKNVKNENNNIPYAEIINYLNEKANKSFKSPTEKTRDFINSRWKEGHRLEDFKQVIDICVEKWTGTTFSNGDPGEKYLQPSTLFNKKFDERLNWTKKGQSNKKADSRDKEIEFQKFVQEGGDPNNFNWKD